MNITPEVCENCLECTKATACPGLTTIDTDYGNKIDTDLTWCVNDGACERVRASNEIGTIGQTLPQLRAGDGRPQQAARATRCRTWIWTNFPEPTCVHDLTPRRRLARAT